MAIDWAATGAMLSGIGAIGGGAAIIVAATLGKKAVGDLRREKLTEREIAHAEKALALAYKLQSAISSIRSPVTTGFESQKSREELESLDWFGQQDQRSQERTIYANIFYQRIREFEEDFTEAFAILPTLKAFFGSASEQAMRTIIHARHKVRVYADAHMKDRGKDLGHTRTIESYIWEGAAPEGKDPIADEVKDAVRILEGQMLPILRADEKKLKLEAASA